MRYVRNRGDRTLQDGEMEEADPQNGMQKAMRMPRETDGGKTKHCSFPDREGDKYIFGGVFLKYQLL